MNSSFKIEKNVYIYKKEIKSISDYVTAITKIKTSQQFGDTWFRGIKDYTYDLIPSGCRNEEWEYETSGEYQLISEFIHRGKGLINENKNMWEWFSICQHYGIPTRLLDWSQSALVALYFSIEEDHNENPCVWVLDPFALNLAAHKKEMVFYVDEQTRDDDDHEFLEKYKISSKNLPEHPIAVLPAHIDSRIRAQKGCFTIHGTKRSSFQILNENQEKSFLAKIIIDRNSLKLLRNQLDILGINTFDIYPDLSGLAKELLWKQKTNS